MGGTPVGRLTVPVVAAPPLIAIILWLGMLAITGISGTHPVWNVRARSISEAAAFRDAGAVVRLAKPGSNLNQPQSVRAGIISDQPLMLTPIEAAAVSRQSEMVQLLLNLGASLDDAAEWQRAWCLAGDSEARILLDAHRPSGAVSGFHCAESH